MSFADVITPTVAVNCVLFVLAKFFNYRLFRLRCFQFASEYVVIVVEPNRVGDLLLDIHTLFIGIRLDAEKHMF